LEYLVSICRCFTEKGESFPETSRGDYQDNTVIPQYSHQDYQPITIITSFPFSTSKPYLWGHLRHERSTVAETPQISDHTILLHNNAFSSEGHKVLSQQLDRFPIDAKAGYADFQMEYSNGRLSIEAELYQNNRQRELHLAFLDCFVGSDIRYRPSIGLRKISDRELTFHRRSTHVYVLRADGSVYNFKTQAFPSPGGICKYLW
jgi:hypothetical protein